ncbi:hypothetical protein [Rufibacter roseus]|uniref:Uncharacterized protein n=1 Tax=Rufibacter roseus TaxID=1567108 RepID=A0ABW2DU67_9BACT|nr:hypothetical protein [Rufibacter roseus]
MEKKTKGIIWRCNLAGKVVEVVKTDFPDVANLALDQQFTDLLEPDCLETVRQWWKLFPQESALMGDIFLKNYPQDQAFTLGATFTTDEIWLFLSTASVAQSDTFQIVNGQIEPSKIWEPDVQHIELLEELSRVNNQLVNARRELIRQNIELHRAHQRNEAIKS